MGNRPGSSEKTDPYTLLVATDRSETGSTHGACLVVIRGPRLGARLDLDNLPLVIGRGASADFRIPSRSVSRSHCRVFVNDGELWVEDLRSTNQTLINGQPVDRQPLEDGDQLRIGDSVLKYLAEGNAEVAFLAEMRESVIRDELTGLHNRRHLMATLSDVLSSRRDTDAPTLSLAILDVDRFKDINDVTGHLAGDEVLRQLAAVLSAEVRKDDLLARIGGEEFAILMPGHDLASARSACERIRAAVEAHRFRVDERDEALPVTVSIGVAEWSPSMNDSSDLLRVADDLLYRSKNAGRNRVCA
jgi:diguanylate cyclase (GGDEF)-like protein